MSSNHPPPRTRPPTHSIVEYFYPPESKGHRCGYCKSPSSNFTHGMWAHTISPENYEHLINIGWRRSGSYLYKPMNEKVCCPMYTIRNLATTAEISRSQRKVLKKFKKYIADGVRSKSEEEGGQSSSSSDKREHHSPEIRQVPKESVVATSVIQVPTEISEHSMTLSSTPTTSIDSVQVVSSQQQKKQHPLKRKHLRRERKRQKLIAKGEDPEAFFKRNERNRIAELESFFAPQEGDKLRFTTKLVKVDSAEFADLFQLEHSLYQKYQMHTHGDNAHECRASQFKRFLCDNPFNNDDDEDEEEPVDPFPQGTYHQHYYVNTTLIAVGVVDILPHCVSSVYFFYDPDYSFLSPGTLGALHEIAFVNSLNRRNAQLEYYYLGYYIHNCVKMKYKRKFRPCQLVCPISLDWVRFDERVEKILDRERYACLKEADAVKKPRNNEDVQRVLLLYNRRVYEYGTYAHRINQHDELQSYVNLVSASVAAAMLLYRSSSSS